MTLSHETTTQMPKTPFAMPLDMAICQADYPLDWYQEAFVPYAQEYQALPDRTMSTIVPWMAKFIEPAKRYFGDDLLLLAHYYMGGEIVKMVEHFGGYVGDSYQLALMAQAQPEKKMIVESAVHFMAETISIMARADQNVYITNPKSGCTMEMHSKESMVSPALMDLNDRYGQDHILPVCYMNTSGRLKALAGAQGGAVCTSSNVKKIFAWAIEKNKKIFFIPDKHMGENVARWLNIPSDEIAYWPGGVVGANYSLHNVTDDVRARFDRARLVIFSSECSVHSFYRASMVTHWQSKGYHVVVHPECRAEVVSIADSWGSTATIWDLVANDRAGTKRYAIATENHLVENVRLFVQRQGIEVVNVAKAESMGCGCATMSRNDPPHLVAVLDLLRKGQLPEFNRVLPGDIVNEFTGQRQRLSASDQAWLQENAQRALQKMIDIVNTKGVT